MRIEYSSRACAVLYNVLKSNNLNGKVLIPANICETIPVTYMKCGFKCFFCDISKEDWQLDKDQTLNIIENEDISVLHYNHTYGYISDEDDKFLLQVKQKFPEIFIVDDRCLCFPELKGVSNSADLILYSTGKLKCVDIGWGGFGFLADGVKYSINTLPYNEADNKLFERHMKECRAEIGKHVDIDIVLSDWLQIDNNFDNYFIKVEEELKKIKAHKNQINNIYKNLNSNLGEAYNNWRFELLVDNPDECRNVLFENNLFCSSHYISLGNGFFQDIKTPVCDYLKSHVLNLFNDSYYSVLQAIQTAEILKKVAVQHNIN